MARIDDDLLGWETIRQLAARYPEVRRWEFWNEPEMWDGARNAPDYEWWYRAFYAAIKAVSPSARIAETKAASVALFRRDGAALRQLQEANPGFFAQLDRAVRVPILAGAGAALILQGDTVLGALAVSGGMMPGQDDECAEAGLTALAP